MANRRRKYTWFPVIGTVGPGETGDNFAQRIFTLSVAPNGGTEIAITPIVPDVPLEGDDIDVTAGGQLSQALGQEYVIERIVGKLFLSVHGPGDDGAGAVFPKVLLVGAGFFVARANDSDVGGGPDAPIGSATVAERIENYGVLGEDAIREPWMWRRTWVLSTQRPRVAFAANSGAFQPVRNTIAGTGLSQNGGAPNTNIDAASSLDGPHFDVKSVRRVGNDERLYFVVSVRTLDNVLTADPPNQVLIDGLSGVLDFRVLGQLRRAKGKSSF